MQMCRQRRGLFSCTEEDVPEEPERRKEEKKKLQEIHIYAQNSKITRIHSVMVVRGARTQPIMN